MLQIRFVANVHNQHVHNQSGFHFVILDLKA